MASGAPSIGVGAAQALARTDLPAATIAIALRLRTPASSDMARRSAQSVSASPRGATLASRNHAALQGGIPMAYDLLIKNGLIVDGSGMPAFPRRCRHQERQDRRDRQIERRGRPHDRRRRPRRRPRLYRQPLPLRRPGHLGSALHLLARAWRHHRDLRQLLVVVGAGAQGHRGTAGRVPLLCRSDPDGGVAHGRVRLGDDRPIHGPSRQTPRHQCRQSDRPYRGAPLRDGRRVPEAGRLRQPDQGDAGCRPRRHEGRRARPLGVARARPLRSAGCATSRPCGPTKRRFSRSATCCARWAPARSRPAAASMSS